MKRKIYENLLIWKNSPYRKPLLLRGARQVGKSFILREFAKNEFSEAIEINFELQTEMKSVFQSIEPKNILKNIELLTNRSVDIGKAILFLDEIQECPDAIMSLRYFYELLPKFPIVVAGSLLEFIWNQESFRAPVGRIEYLYMYPMDFEEFLDAIGENVVLAYLKEVTLKELVNESVHKKLLEYYREYLLVGGMPEVVKVFSETGQFSLVKKVQTSLLQTYKEDFSKYANKSKQRHLEKIFTRVPILSGKKLKYTDIDSEISSRELKLSIELLEFAGVVHRVTATSSPGLPLSYHEKENFYKLIFLDTGLSLKSSGLEETILKSPDLLGVYEGGLAEQFVGQELIALSTSDEKAKLYYWERMKKGSNAEIDYLLVHNSRVYPIEVKSGSTGSLKSLGIYRKEYNPILAIRYSTHILSLHEGLLSIPLYMIGQTKRLINLII